VAGKELHGASRGCQSLERYSGARADLKRHKIDLLSMDLLVGLAARAGLKAKLTRKWSSMQLGVFQWTWLD
jgi:hypothetical protein